MRLIAIALALALIGAAFGCAQSQERPPRASERASATWTPTPTPEPAPTWTPTPTPEPAPTWTPTPAPESAASASVSDVCEFAIRSALSDKPLLAEKALATNPAALTDRERALWLHAVGEWEDCAELWSQPATDAPNKRNDQLAGECYHELTRAAVEMYRDQWLNSGEYHQFDIGDGSGDYWNDASQNSGLLAMEMLAAPYDADADRRGLAYFLSNYAPACERWYPQIFTGRWTPTRLDEVRTPYPSPTPTPSGYRRDLTMPDAVQLQSYHE